MPELTNKIANNSLLVEIIKKIPEALIVCDKDFNVIFVNEQFYKLYGSNDIDLSKYKLNELIDNSSNTICEVCNCSETNLIPEDKYFHQAVLTNNEGKDVLIRISHSLINDGEYYINIIQPMSNLVCLNQAQVDFVSTVSHELRTPMTSIKGFADTLLSAGDQLTKEQQTRFINIIKSQADRLTRLVENLLTVSRL
ncbi:MAG: histidine kinase dimerization/phospho-acceptor domain-containing protein, partial [Vampirovibrionia bacterium]